MKTAIQLAVVVALAGATPLKQFETHNALNQREFMIFDIYIVQH